ncbi:MAG: hypothetical protein KDA68_15550, partial [Planctomycetaceae bacterium]|nr:hypothetical protein [Planctomycetaceae bacterium]
MIHSASTLEKLVAQAVASVFLAQSLSIITASPPARIIPSPPATSNSRKRGDFTRISSRPATISDWPTTLKISYIEEVAHPLEAKPFNEDEMQKMQQAFQCKSGRIRVVTRYLLLF